MAEKEATAYVIDVGKSMGLSHNGRAKSDLDWAMQYVWDKITTNISRGRKTLCDAVIAARTDQTNHGLMGEDGYENISVLKDIGQMFMQDVRNLQETIKPSSTDAGDVVSAVVVAGEMLVTFCKKNKWRKRVILVTNGGGLIDSDSLDDIAQRFVEEGIELIVLGADFDDLEYGFKEEDKPDHKAQNEALFRSLTEKCNGMFGTLDEAISELQIPRVKEVKSMANYKGKLRIGQAGDIDPANPDKPMAIEIDVERFPRIMVATAPTSTRLTSKSGGDVTQSTAPADDMDLDTKANGDETAVVHQARTYQIKDDAAPGGKRDVDKEDLAKGYEYGRTAVHIAESELTVTQLDTESGLDVIGFMHQDNFRHYMDMSRTNVIVARRTDDKAVLALSSFIHALHEHESYALARLVVKDGKAPLVILLAPHIKPDFECLIDIEMPFAEDRRDYRFPPLDRILTVSGKTVKEHRHLPSQELLSAMESYVESMDISAADMDEGVPTEYLAIDDAYSPKFHRLKQAIQYRAIYPKEPVPPPPEAILKYSHPRKDLLEKAEPVLKRLREAADVKKVPPKALSRADWRNKKKQEQPRSGLDVSALLASRPADNKGKISAENAIPEFKQMIAEPDDVKTIHNACSQLGNIIEGWISQMGDSGYGKAVAGLRVMREQCIELEEPGTFNSFMRSLKQQIHNGALDGDRREMWWEIRTNKLGLITKSASPQADVDEEEANKFMLPG